MRQVQVIPKAGYRLYGAMVAKEVELKRKKQGTFRRTALKERNRAKWTHSTYPGWINLRRGMGEVVQMEIKSKKEDTEWQLFHAILGFIDRYFANTIQAVNIQFGR